MIYWYIFSLLSILSFISSKNIQNFFLLIFLIFYIVFIGFRFEIGADWGDYIAMFHEIKHNINHTDVGYEILNIAGDKLFDYNGIFFVNTVCGIIITTCMYFVINEFRHPLISLLILFYYVVTIAMGYSRQGVAIAISMVAIYHALKFRYIKFVLFILFAMTFHKSVAFLFMLFPYLFLTKIKFTKITFFVYTLFFVLLLTSYQKIISYIPNDYLEGTYDSKGVFFRIAVHVPSIFIYFWSKSRFKFKFLNLNYKILDFMAFGIIFMFPFSILFSTLIDRLILYFIIFDLIIFNLFLDCLNKISQVIFKIFLIVENFILFYVWYSYSFYAINYWTPYRNYFLEILF